MRGEWLIMKNEIEIYKEETFEDIKRIDEERDRILVCKRASENLRIH